MSCTPVTFCEPENFGLLFPSLVGPMGPPGGPGTYVVSLAELRLLDPTNFTDGYVANVGGYAAVADGGGGAFAYDPTGTAADNDGTVVSPSNGIGRWNRIYSGPVNLKWFGAMGNNSGDDYQAITNAIEFVETQPSGGGVFAPAGTYRVSDALLISGLVPLYLVGEGRGTVFKTLNPTTCLNVGEGNNDHTIDVRLMDFAIDCDNTGSIGISVNRLHHISTKRIYITGTTVAAVDSNQAYDNEYDDLYIADNAGKGIIFDENNEYSRVYNTKIHRCGTIGIHFRNGSCSGSKISACNFEGNGIGLKIDGGTAEVCQSIGITGNYFKDQVQANCLFGTDGSSFPIDSLLFQNNTVKPGQLSAADNTVEFDYCRKPVLIANTFLTSDVITTANCIQLVEFGNTFDTSANPAYVQLGNASGELRAKLPASLPGTAEYLWQNVGDVRVAI